MYGKFVEGTGNKTDKYGFVDETEIRIAAGLSLVFALLSVYFVIFKGNFNVGLFIVGIIWLDFVLKVFISPDFSIFGRIVRLFIKGKEKIWVGSVQKRFAWSIGLVLSTFVIFCMLLLSGYIESTNPSVLAIMEQISTNITNNALIVLPMNPAILACVLCIVFMFLESVFGICVGCKMYKNLVKKGIMKKIPGQNCVNGACEIK
ncbi:MAG: DUF4395 domain-containing protein [Candidatus Gracilibacteria bacterium]|nr:DUF4395 domain-containing protein [Candidatus Gracilibacteria bacterium]MDQ7023717.1 DUF4395 domain-containing protein [Candidatus Gracilibacteria bacterium]